MRIRLGLTSFCDTTANPLDNALQSWAGAVVRRPRWNLGATLLAGTGSIGMKSTRGYPDDRIPHKPLRGELVGLI
jgi:hypothetical protein